MRPYIPYKQRHPTIPPRLGKRTRRALIRLRHALAAEKFTRWLDKQHLYCLQDEAHKVWPQKWHQWHALGCP